MEVVIYITIFLAGTIFGSFFTLAVYRIPRHENIVYGRSHCTSCSHRLEFWDLIPVLSYLFLKGKCRYCGEKIRIRYLLLEIFSGIVFLTIALTRGLTNMIELCLIYLFIAGMFIVAGINKEKMTIPNGLCIYEFCIAAVHFLWSALVEHIYLAYIIGAFAIPLSLYILKRIVHSFKKEEMKLPFGSGNITYLFVIGFMFGWPIQILALALSSIVCVCSAFIHKRKEIPLGYYLSIATILILIIEPYLVKWIEFARA